MVISSTACCNCSTDNPVCSRVTACSLSRRLSALARLRPSASDSSRAEATSLLRRHWTLLTSETVASAFSRAAAKSWLSRPSTPVNAAVSSPPKRVSKLAKAGVIASKRWRTIAPSSSKRCWMLCSLATTEPNSSPNFSRATVSLASVLTRAADNSSFARASALRSCSPVFCKTLDNSANCSRVSTSSLLKRFSASPREAVNAEVSLLNRLSALTRATVSVPICSCTVSRASASSPRRLSTLARFADNASN
mmetsp:Transcript_58280/g.125193  ORF Transcript_58280/g.125193 Transcript_58280/m.125193 type:complete len:251 (+) Transcript_58280:456-1208(+)